MRFSIVRTIAKKELQESLRDRRTLFVMVGIPLLLYPLAMIGMSKLQESQEEAQKARQSKVAVWGQMPADLARRMAASAGMMQALAWEGTSADIKQQILESRVVTPAPLPLDLDTSDPEKRPKPNLDDPLIKAAQQAIFDRKVDAVLVLWPGFEQKAAAGGAATASIYFDSVRPDSGKARDRVSDALRLWREELRQSREKDRHLTEGFMLGVDIQTQNIAPPKRKSGLFLGMLLPYLLITFSVMSGFYAAIDVTAGEKERGTMQTLLCAPVESLEIITGKFIAVWSITMMATVVNLVSLAATFTRLHIPGMQVTVPVSSYLLAFLLLLPITFMVTAVFLAVGAFAKDFKEGQSYMTPVLMGLIMPLVVTMTPGIELNRHLAFVPVINIALLIRTVFLNEWQPDLLFIVLLSAFSYAALALVFASRVFERNNLLLGGKEGLQSIFDFTRRPGSKPTPALAVFLFAFTLVLLFYGSMAVENRGVVTLLLVTEFVFMLAPAVLLASSKGFGWQDTFSLRVPHWRGILGGLLVGLSGWTIAAGLLIRLMPPPENLLRALEKILLMEKGGPPLWQALLLVAVTPAVCEELVFRGFLQSGFRRLGRWPAIIAAAFLFGLAHSSIYRLLPTFFLGLLFGYAVWRTGSIAIGILCHALNNGLMVSVTRSRDLMHALGIGTGPFLPWTVIGVGAVVLLAGLLLIRSTPSAGERPA